MVAARLPKAGRFSGTLVAAFLLVCGSALADLQPPAGSGPLRYRDVVFPALTKKAGTVYGSAPGASGQPVTLTLDMYRPRGDVQTSRPAIVLVHGGGYVAGNSRNGAMVRIAKAFAQRGYVAVSINYRLLGRRGEKCGAEDPPSPTCTAAVLAAQHDAQAAVRWLRRHAVKYGVDPARIAIAGGSAGAGTALAVAVNSGDAGTSGSPGYSSRVGAAISISGELPHSVASRFFDPSDSPILMFNGTSDPVVPFAMAAQTASDLDAAGVQVVFEPLAGAGHVPFATHGTLMIEQSLYFSYDHLDLANAAGQPTAPPKASITAPRGGSTFTVGQDVRTSFSCAEGNAGPGLASCTDSTGAPAPGGRLDTSTPGDHIYTVTAASRDGRHGAASISYRVALPVPVLSALRLSPRRFMAASHGGPLTARGGVTISYRSSLATVTTVTVYRLASGFVHRGTCVARVRRPPRGATRCTRIVRLGAFTHRDRAGANRLRFSGRLRGHALRPGRYTLTAMASADGRRSRTLSARFEIVA